MTISCPQCGAGYDIPDTAAIAGRKVRCTNCGLVWRFVHEPAPETAAAAAQEAPAETATHMNGGGAEAASAMQAAPPPVQQAPPSPPASTPSSPSLQDMLRQEADLTGSRPSWQSLIEARRTAADSGTQGVSGAAKRTAGVHPAVAEAPVSVAIASEAGRSRIAESIARRRQQRPSSYFNAEAPLDEPTVGHRNGASIRPGVAGHDEALDPGRILSTRGGAGEETFPADTDYGAVLAGSEGDETAGFPDEDIGELDEERSAGPVATGIAWALFVCLLLGLGWALYAYRTDVVRALPGAAGAYARLHLPVNVRGLELSDASYKWQLDAHGRPTLAIAGSIRNITRSPQAVPSVVVAFLDEGGLELFDWASPVRMNSLPPGETTPFSVTVPAPPDAVRSVEIRFATSPGT